MTKTVKITTENPYKEITFDFFESEPVDVKVKQVRGR